MHQWHWTQLLPWMMRSCHNQTSHCGAIFSWTRTEFGPRCRNPYITAKSTPPPPLHHSVSRSADCMGPRLRRMDKTTVYTTQRQLNLREVDRRSERKKWGFHATCLVRINPCRLPVYIYIPSQPGWQQDSPFWANILGIHVRGYHTPTNIEINMP